MNDENQPADLSMLQWRHLHNVLYLHAVEDLCDVITEVLWVILIRL